MRVNPAKTRVTFDLRPGPHVPRLPRNTVTDGCHNEFVPWCATSTAATDNQCLHTALAELPCICYASMVKCNPAQNTKLPCDLCDEPCLRQGLPYGNLHAAIQITPG